MTFRVILPRQVAEALVARAIRAAMTMAVVFAGCATPEPVMLRNPQTNVIAQCVAGYRAFIDGQGYRTQEDCIADYQRKGYEQMSAPAGAK